MSSFITQIFFFFFAQVCPILTVHIHNNKWLLSVFNVNASPEKPCACTSISATSLYRISPSCFVIVATRNVRFCGGFFSIFLMQFAEFFVHFFWQKTTWGGKIAIDWNCFARASTVMFAGKLRIVFDARESKRHVCMCVWERKCWNCGVKNIYMGEDFFSTEATFLAT